MVWRQLRLAHLLHHFVRALWLLVSSANSGLQIPQRGGGGRVRGTDRKKLIDTAQQAPETVILAMDEASLYLQATTMAVWGPIGQPLTVRCDPSRAKTSFYGALNLKTGQVRAQEVEHMTA